MREALKGIIPDFQNIRLDLGKGEMIFLFA